MIDLSPDTNAGAPRRRFFGRLTGAIAIGAASIRARADPAVEDGPDWPGTLKARHRQVVDAFRVNEGHALDFAYNFVATNLPGAAVSVVILRAGALPIALDSAIWAKYKIGETFKIIDPETKAPAVKNPFLHPKPGVLMRDDAALDRLLAKGTIFAACEVALRGQSKKLAGGAGMSADDAAREWAANVVPGIAIIPSGVWGLNRAQEGGCTYCSGG